MRHASPKNPDILRTIAPIPSKLQVHIALQRHIGLAPFCDCAEMCGNAQLFAAFGAVIVTSKKGALRLAIGGLLA
jgi:hypothetical protein